MTQTTVEKTFDNEAKELNIFILIIISLFLIIPTIMITWKFARRSAVELQIMNEIKNKTINERKILESNLCIKSGGIIEDFYDDGNINCDSPKK